MIQQAYIVIARRMFELKQGDLVLLNYSEGLSLYQSTKIMIGMIYRTANYSGISSKYFKALLYAIAAIISGSSDILAFDFFKSPEIGKVYPIYHSGDVFNVDGRAKIISDNELSIRIKVTPNKGRFRAFNNKNSLVMRLVDKDYFVIEDWKISKFARVGYSDDFTNSSCEAYSYSGKVDIPKKSLLQGHQIVVGPYTGFAIKATAPSISYTFKRWHDINNWRKIRTGLDVRYVENLLGQPNRIQGGFMPTYTYSERVNGKYLSGSVTFYKGVVNMWSEPKF